MLRNETISIIFMIANIDMNLFHQTVVDHKKKSQKFNLSFIHKIFVKTQDVSMVKNQFETYMVQ